VHYQTSVETSCTLNLRACLVSKTSQYEAVISDYVALQERSSLINNWAAECKISPLLHSTLNHADRTVPMVRICQMFSALRSFIRSRWCSQVSRVGHAGEATMLPAFESEWELFEHSTRWDSIFCFGSCTG
jgi:hypothetical protein